MNLFICFRWCLSEARRLATLITICHPSAPARHEAIRLVTWHPSRENCFVLNVDGSCNVLSGRAGTGGLIRRGDGSWVIGTFVIATTTILDLLNLDWEVKFCHTLREGNASADFLAKWSSSNDIKWKLWNSPLEDLNLTVRNDRLRTPIPRM
ncbi:unnamed protein product [Trifolium pratense]|uniref:Uncharacterized protein n=1 Tax=Trifolium pratense TaxID=57577 RepID=A0ACB0K8K2_TRIPR|nr:unnamed protein product [Trifolium pratense]